MRILIIYDVKGWAWWHKARAIAQHMGSDIEVELACHDQKVDANRYDYVIMFGPYMIKHLPTVPAQKRILGVSNTIPGNLKRIREIAGAGLVRAVAANCEIGFKALSDLESLFYCPNGVDADFFHPPATAPDNFSACWVGNPDSSVIKGFELVKEACQLAGVELRTVTHDARKGDTLGIVSHDSLRQDIYWPSSVFICASLYDGTPNPALEALACGLPVLSTYSGNMPEIIENGVNGLLVERNAQALAQGLIDLAAANRTQMSRAARASIENGWTWTHQSANYERMIRTLAREDGRS